MAQSSVLRNSCGVGVVVGGLGHVENLKVNYELPGIVELALKFIETQLNPVLLQGACAWRLF